MTNNGFVLDFIKKSLKKKLTKKNFTLIFSWSFSIFVSLIIFLTLLLINSFLSIIPFIPFLPFHNLPFKSYKVFSLILWFSAGFFVLFRQVYFLKFNFFASPLCWMAKNIPKPYLIFDLKTFLKEVFFNFLVQIGLPILFIFSFFVISIKILNTLLKIPRLFNNQYQSILNNHPQEFSEYEKNKLNKNLSDSVSKIKKKRI